MKIRLKPYPFCGGKAKIIKGALRVWIHCFGCGIELAAHYLTEEDAAYDWNRRVGENYEQNIQA